MFVGNLIVEKEDDWEKMYLKKFNLDSKIINLSFFFCN